MTDWAAKVSPTDPSRVEGHAIFVLPALAMGGTEKQLMTILEADPGALVRHRIELLTFLPTANDLIVARLNALGIPVHSIDRSTMRFPAFFLELVRFFRTRRPDLVHTFLAGSTGTWGRLAARLAGVRHVVLSDRSLAPKMTRTQLLIDPLVTRLTTRFVANAQATVERLERHGAPKDKIVLVRNGVDVARYARATGAALRADWGARDGAVVAGFLGMFRPVKRPELFLRAVLEIPEASRPDLVVLAGDGERMPDVRRIVESDPWLTSHCRLLGVVDDTAAFLRAVDFLVLSSDAEGLPNAILEAMAAGVPCVATSVSDVPFLVEDERFLAPAGDASALADAMSRMLMLSPAERRAIGEALRDRAEREFGLEAAAKRFWAVHDGLWSTSRA